MPNRQKIVLRTTVYVFIVCVAFISFDVWESWTMRSFQLHELETATTNLAMAMSQQADDALKEVDTALIGIVSRIEMQGNNPAAVEQHRRIMKIRKTELVQIDTLSVYDADGRLVVSTDAASADRINEESAEFFAFHRHHPDTGPHIGIPVLNRSTGKWVIPLSRRLYGTNGDFSGVAVATIDLDYFRKFYETLQIGSLGVIGMASNQGIILIRSPHSSNFFGKDIRGTKLFREYSPQKSNKLVVLAANLDGVERFISYRPLTRYPFFVYAGMAKDEKLGAWWRETALHTMGVLCLLLLVGLLGWRLVTQIKLQVRTEEDLVKARDLLEVLAMEDGLTGLSNRRWFDNTLRNECGRAARQGNTLALVMIDVDHFKRYNDIYGHLAGDECLRSIGNVIKAVGAKRNGDLAARYGGEEFALILPNTDIAGAITTAEKIRSQICRLCIEHKGNPAGVATVSIGCGAHIPEHDPEEPARLILEADTALYKAKQAGRNCVVASE